MSKLFQASTALALMSGDYDYTMSIEYFMKNGDTGLGTYNGLNGEAIFLNGIAYNGTAAGNVKIMDIPQTGVTFGQIVRFNDLPDIKPLSLKAFASLSELTDSLSVCLLKGPNYFYIIKADGLFSKIAVRSAYKQRKPFRPMSEVVREMRSYSYDNTEGTLVGIYTPAYADGLSIRGWHLHFISKDKLHGGHVIEAAGQTLDVKVNLIDKFEIKLPSGKDFISKDLASKEVADSFAAYRSQPPETAAAAVAEQPAPEAADEPKETGGSENKGEAA